MSLALELTNQILVDISQFCQANHSTSVTLTRCQIAFECNYLLRTANRTQNINTQHAVISLLR